METPNWHKRRFSDLPDKVSENTHPWRRFLARSIDYYILYVVLFMAVSFFALDTSFEDRVFSKEGYGATFFCSGVIWIFLETVSLQLSGTTPGKYILGIRVVHSDGSKASPKSLLSRSFCVWVYGAGCNLAFLYWFTCYASYSKLALTGTTIWDEKADTALLFSRYSKLIAFFAYILLSIQIAYFELGDYAERLKLVKSGASPFN